MSDRIHMNGEGAGSAPADFRKARRRKSELVDPAKLDRLPPHSTEAEQGVLGCILLSPDDCMAECAAKLAGPQAFYDLRHRTIYEELLGTAESGTAIDMITLQQRLKDKQLLEGVGGLSYLASLPDAVPSAANLEYYLQIVREKHVLRELIQTCTEVVSRAYEHHGEIDQTVAEAVDGVSSVGRLLGNDASGDNKATLREIISDWEDAAQGKTPAGIRMGFIDLDVLTSGGLKPSQLVILAARPAKGKTSFALNVAERVSVDDGIPVGVFSLEMSGKELLQRMVCARARIESGRVTRGQCNEREVAQLIKAQKAIATAPLHIIDQAGLSIARFAGMATSMVQRHGIKLLIVDRLCLLRADGKPRSRYETVTEQSNAMKALAMNLGIPVIALTQLNRDVERDDREPRLSDLRDSGSIEQDADIVLLLHPDSSDHGDAQACKLIIAKHRNGPTDVVRLRFFRQFTRFESANPNHP